jgi:hypothetical protein
VKAKKKKKKKKKKYERGNHQRIRRLKESLDGTTPRLDDEGL